LKPGDELSVAYVDVGLHPGESKAECRRRRRQELARGWRFACACERCVAEAPTEQKTAVNGDATTNGQADGEAEMPKEDESKVESTTRHEGAGIVTV